MILTDRPALIDRYGSSEDTAVEISFCYGIPCGLVQASSVIYPGLTLEQKLIAIGQIGMRHLETAYSKCGDVYTVLDRAILMMLTGKGCADIFVHTYQAFNTKEYELLKWVQLQWTGLDLEEVTYLVLESGMLHIMNKIGKHSYDTHWLEKLMVSHRQKTSQVEVMALSPLLPI